MGGGLPQPSQAGGTPARSGGRGTTAWGEGGTTAGEVGIPPQVPLSDLAGGTPVRGTPPWVPPIRSGWGYPCWRVPHLRYPCQTWLGGTPPQVAPSDLARGTPARGGGYTTLGTPHQTWSGGYPTSLAL